MRDGSEACPIARIDLPRCVTTPVSVLRFCLGKSRQHRPEVARHQEKRAPRSGELPVSTNG